MTSTQPNQSATAQSRSSAPVSAGISLRAAHVAEVIERAPEARPSWVELHPEELFPGVATVAVLARVEELRAQRPVSLHGVGLALGAEQGLDPAHLERLKVLFEHLDPCLFSEHLAWSTHEAAKDVTSMPPPFDAATLDRVCRHIDQTQGSLGRRMLLENPVQYVRLANSTMTEIEFLAAIVERTGCGLLLDIDNAFVGAANNKATTEEYLSAFPVEAIGEIHLGGRSEALDAEGRAVLNGGAETPETVWSLYEALIARIGPRATLIEWDGGAPDWSRLEPELARADAILSARTADAPTAAAAE